MKLLHLNKKDKELVFISETIEDLWILKNIIEIGDLIKGTSYRRQRQDELNSSVRKPVFVVISIEKFDYSSELDSLRFTGKIIESKPQDLAPIGEHHTIEIKLNEKYVLIKNNLYEHQINLIKRTNNFKANILLIAIDDESSDIFKISNTSISSVAKINSPKSGKRYECDEQKKQYFENVFEVIAKFVANQIIVAGPGFTKSDLISFLKLKNNKFKLNEVSIQNTSKSSINELFTKKEVAKIFENSLLIKEQEILNSFKENLGKNNGKAIYGIKEISYALSKGAIKEILISERFWRDNMDLIQKLVLSAEKLKTYVHIIDSSHNEIIKTLNSFGGLIANLRFKIN